MIRVIDLHKSYRETIAVTGLSFEAAAGEVIGFVGPNGAGKTTTLRALAGIIPPTSGQLLIGGYDVRSEPVAAKKRLGYVPDDPKLFDTLTVAEHLEFVAAAYEVSDFSAKRDRILERFELTEKRDALGQELSRGMRQKVAICCACLHDPGAMLLDEPMTGLDPRGIRNMKETIREQAQAGAAVVISSHQLSVVEDLCTSLLILCRGKRLFFGPIAEARATFTGLEKESSLEEIFFRAVEEPLLSADGAPNDRPA